MANLSTDLIDIKLTTPELATIKTGISTIRSGLSNVERALTPEQRRSLYSLGPKRKVMAQEAMQEATHNGSILPPAISTTRLGNDLDLYVQLDGIEHEIKGLLQRVQDAKRLAGHEAFTMTKAIYKFFRSLAAVGVPGAQHSADRLGRHYSKSTGAPSTNEDYTHILATPVSSFKRN
jgi:hypothetical protein